MTISRILPHAVITILVASANSQEMENRQVVVQADLLSRLASFEHSSLSSVQWLRCKSSVAEA